MDFVRIRRTALFCLVCALPGSARADSPSVLLKCRFVRSLSVSFGYSDVYTVTGDLKDAGPPSFPFFESSGLITASVDQTASTNFPGKHLGDTPVTLNNHTGSGEALLDIRATTEVNGEGFRILVFSNPSGASWSAYEMLWPSGEGIAGSCESLDPRLE